MSDKDILDTLLVDTDDNMFLPYDETNIQIQEEMNDPLFYIDGWWEEESMFLPMSNFNPFTNPSKQQKESQQKSTKTKQTFEALEDVSPTKRQQKVCFSSVENYDVSFFHFSFLTFQIFYIILKK